MQLTHCILVDFSTVICWATPFVILGVLGLFSRFYSFFIENRHDVASDLDLHCLPMTYASFTGFQTRMGLSDFFYLVMRIHLVKSAAAKVQNHVCGQRSPRMIKAYIICRKLKNFWENRIRIRSDNQ